MDSRRVPPTNGLLVRRAGWMSLAFLGLACGSAEQMPSNESHLPPGGSSGGFAPDGGAFAGGGPASGGTSPTSGGAPATSGGGSMASGGGVASTGGGLSESGGAADGGSTQMSSGGATGGVADNGSGGIASTGGATNEPVFHVFLLIGQSNMAGGADTTPEDREEEPRIRVLGYDDCTETGRRYNEWDTASPPLHACWLRGIGPGDYFAKTLLPLLPAGDTIGLVPVAIPGVDIDFFRKGVTSARRSEFVIPPDDHWNTAYDWLMERARLAQDAGGVIDGVLFHQGESDSGQTVWLDKVSEMVDDLRADLDLGEVPFIAGEMLRGGQAEGHNAIIAQLPGRISNALVVSSEGLGGVDQFHFDAAGVRTLGERYGEAMAQALGLTP